MRELLRRELDKIRRRLRLMVSRAILTAAADDSGVQQLLDLVLLADEERAKVARMQQYGLTSVPPKDSEAVCVAVGGVRDHLVAIAVDDTADRPTGLLEGEVALWTKKGAVRVKLVDDGHVDLGTSPTDPVALAPLTRAEFDAVKADVDVIKNWCTTHTHPVVLGTLTATPSPSPLVLTWSPGDVAAQEVRAK